MIMKKRNHFVKYSALYVLAIIGIVAILIPSDGGIVTDFLKIVFWYLAAFGATVLILILLFLLIIGKNN